MNVPLLWLLRRFKLKTGTSLAKFKTAFRTLLFRRAHSELLYQFNYLSAKFLRANGLNRIFSTVRFLWPSLSV